MLIEVTVINVVLGIIALFSLIGIVAIAYLFVKFKRMVMGFISSLWENSMDRADLEEFIQRQFVILTKDDKLFKRHVERLVGDSD